MKSFFNVNFKLQPDTFKVGVFDPYYKRYIVAETAFTRSLPPIAVQVQANAVPPNAYAFSGLINNVILVQ
jgi:hypothetical protein